MHQYNFHEREAKTSVLLGLITCILIVAAAAALGKAMVNLKAALIDKPDVGIYLLMPDMKLGDTELLRDMDTERDYYAESKEGPLLVHLNKVKGQWTVSSYEHVHPMAGDPVTGTGAMHQ